MILKYSSLLFTFLSVAQFSYGQASVSTSGSKYVLVEESTGAWCGFCPDGALVLESILSANPKAIGVAIHDNNDGISGNVNANDSMEILEGAIFDTTGGPASRSYCSGFPSGAIDRNVYSGSVSQVIRSIWPSRVAAAASNVANFDITLKHTYDSATRTITIYVYATTLHNTSGTYNMNAYITEDSIASSGPGYAQHSYFYKTAGHALFHRGVPNSDSSSAILGISDYRHMNVLRAMLGGTFGTVGVIDANAPAFLTYSHKYTYIVPPLVNIKHLNIIGLVQKNDPGNIFNRAIDNSIKAKLDIHAKTASVEEIGSLLGSAHIYPVPASNQIHIEAYLAGGAQAKVIICNALGQVVINDDFSLNGSYLSADVSIKNLSNGLYFLKIISDGASVDKKLVVSNM